MSQRSQKKARQGKAAAAHSSAPVSPAGEMPGVKDSRSLKSESHPAGLNDRWPVYGVCIFLAAIVWVVFGQTLVHKFVNYDDDFYVYENPEVARGLTLQGIRWAFTNVHCSNWHPLTWVSHMLDCQLYGLNPGGHHLTNILLHTATAILLFLVLRRMTGFLWRSAFVATVFAIHPLRVESVAWVAERKDVLSAFFFMLTLGAYARYAQCVTGDKRQVTRTAANNRAPGPSRVMYHPSLLYCLVLLFFALGLMCKPMLVTLPLVLLLLDFWPLGRVAGGEWRVPRFGVQVPHHADATTCRVETEQRREQSEGGSSLNHLLYEKLPLFGLAVASGVITIFAQTGDLSSFEQISLPLRVGNASISYVAYLGQMFWPSGLAVLYPFTARNIGVSEVVLSLVLLAGISTGVFVLRRRCPCFLTGWLWYLIMLAPVIGIVQVGAQTRADRYTYLPQIGLYLLLTWAAADLCAGWRHRRVVLVGFSTIILVALIFCARAQTAYWRNSESLWTHTLACTSDNFIGHNNLGNALLKTGNVDEAITHFQKALEIKPDFAEAHSNLGNFLFQKGSLDEAMVHYQMALEIKPDYADAHYNLGNALLQKGNVDEAITHFQKALEIKPDFADAHNNLGYALIQKRSVDEAITHFQKALQINPDYADAHNNLGSVLLRKGNVDKAITHFQRALEIKPDFADAHNNLGYALIQKRSVDEAITHFQKALQINPDYADAHNNLGSALLRKGNVDEAIVHFQKVLEIKPDYLDVQNNLAWVLATSPQASLRNGNKAVELAQRANQLTGGENPVILHTLAAAYAEVGRFSDAMRSAQKAIELAQAAGQKDLPGQLNGELKLYEAGLPFHEKSK